MKVRSLLVSMLCMLALSVSFASCSDDDDLLDTRVRDKDCVKNRVKRAKIVRFTLC